MKSPLRPNPIRRCPKCSQDKTDRDFYAATSCCMECKRAAVKSYKDRTGYNRQYRERMRA